ncbi:hypothetical protein [Vreelandella neptunia]|uniref:hypothetical protein n=1 Tax=Vreelandella neptunia TaxID=115551 RepID=UPI00315B2C86
MAQNYKTGLIITGDASGGIRAIKATDDELGKLNKGFDRGSRRSKQFNQNVNATSQGLTVLKRAAAPLAGAIAGMFAANTIQNQVDWGDQLQKTNLRIGASTEALSQYNYVAKLSGVEFGQLTTAWQRQTRRIAEAAAGTGVAAEALDRLGLSAQALNQLAPEDQFERIATAMQNVESSSERVALAQKLWDSEGVKLVQIVNQGTDAIAAMRAEADALGLTISQDTANAMATYNDEVDRLKFAAQGLSQTIAAEMVPSMTAGLQATSSFIHEIGGAETILDLAKDTATLLAGVLAGRLVGSLATSTAGMVAAQAQSIRYQATLASMAGVSRAAVASQIALGAAARGASTAMLLVGGPGGAAVIAVGALYYFREELGLVDVAAQNATHALDANSDAIRDGSAAALDATYDNLVNSLEAVSLQAQEAMAQLTELEARQSFYDNSHKGVADSVSGAVDQQTEALADLWARQVELQNAIRDNRAARENATEADREGVLALEDMVVTATAAAESTAASAAASRDAAKANTTLADSYENLLDRIQPNRSAARQYAKDLGVLNLALASGRMTTVQYMQAMGLLQENFQAAQRDTNDLADTAEDAGSRIANSFTTWGTIADNTLRSVDDSGRDAWLGLIDGSTSALDTIERAFEQTAANILHMLTTQKFTFQVAGMMGLDTTGMPGGGSVGFDVGSMSSLKNGWDTVSGLWGGGSAAASTAAAGYTGALGAGTATGYGGAVGSAVSGAASASGGFMSAAGAAMPWLAGGFAIDNILGLGITDGITKAITGIFSHSPTEFKGEFVTRDSQFDAAGYSRDDRVAAMRSMPNQDFYYGGFYQQSQFGDLGFSHSGSQRLHRADGGPMDDSDLHERAEWGWELAEQAAGMDNFIASLAQGSDQIAVMRDAVQSLSMGSGDAAEIVQFALVDRSLAALDAAGIAISERFRSMNAEQFAQEMQQAVAAVNLLSSASGRLNLQFDATSSNMLSTADNLAQMMGGPDGLANAQSQYYEAFFTDQEKFQHLTQDLTSTLAPLGLALPESQRGVRELVEGLDVMTEAGQRQLAAVYQNVPALSEYVRQMEEQQRAAQEAAQAANQAAQAERELAAEREAERTQLLNRTSLYSSGIVGGVDDALDAYNEQMSLASEAARQREQQLRDELNAIQQLGNLLDSLALSDQSILDPAQRLQEAQRQFAELQVRAENGDTEAASQLQGASNAYLTEAANYYGQSSSQYAEIYDDVTSSVRSLEDIFGESVATLGTIESIERQMLREQQRAREMLSSSLSEEVRQSDLLGSIADLIDLLPSSLASAISSILPEFGDNSGGGFDEAAYLANKTAQVNEVGQDGRTDWTQQQVLDAIIRDYGSIQAHYAAVGRGEGIQPYYDADTAPASVGGSNGGGSGSTAFDQAAYLANKTSQVNANGQGGSSSWTQQQVLDAIIRDYGSVEAHYNAIGKNEGVTPYATGAWSIPGDQLAMIHDREMVVPSREGIADEFRAYAAGDYQRELMGELGNIQRALPMPNMPPMPMQSQTNPQADNNAALLRAFAGMREDNSRLIERVGQLEEQLAAIAGNTGEMVEPTRRTATAAEETERNSRLKIRNPA